MSSNFFTLLASVTMMHMAASCDDAFDVPQGQKKDYKVTDPVRFDTEH